MFAGHGYKVDLLDHASDVLAGAFVRRTEPILEIAVRESIGQGLTARLCEAGGAVAFQTEAVAREFGSCPWHGGLWEVNVTLLPIPDVEEDPKFAAFMQLPTFRERLRSLPTRWQEVDANRTKVDEGPCREKFVDVNGRPALEPEFIRFSEGFDHSTWFRRKRIVHAALRLLADLRPKEMARHHQHCLADDLLEKASWDADAFASSYRAFLNFRSDLERVYRTNLRSDYEGKPDDAKSKGGISRFLRREAVPGSEEKWSRDIMAEDIATFISRFPATSTVEPTVRYGLAFESEVLTGLERLGYSVEPTPTTGDFGADLVAEKDDLRYAIQCKAHAKPVGVKAVQEAHTARRYYRCDYAVVVSENGFTPAAMELAHENGVVCINFGRLALLESMACG